MSSDDPPFQPNRHRRPRADRRVDRARRARALVVDAASPRSIGRRCWRMRSSQRRDRSRGEQRRRRSVPSIWSSWRRRSARTSSCCRRSCRVCRDGAIVTDVGGTKRDIVERRGRAAVRDASFVGGHPIGGAERGGFGFARPDLFRGKPWIFTPVTADVVRPACRSRQALRLRPRPRRQADDDGRRDARSA